MLIVGVLEKIFAMNERVRQHIQRYMTDTTTPNTLTEYAMARYMAAQHESRSGGSNAMHITLLSPFAATVRNASENFHTGTVYSVDLNARECSCFKWQQTGIPCSHACYFMTILGMSSNDIFTTGYLLPICFTDYWKKFYSHDTMIGKVPGDGEVERALTDNIVVYPTLIAKLTAPAEDQTRVTKKRLRGSEEKSTKGSIPSSAMKGRHICLKCGKSISNSTKHEWKACENWGKKKKLDSQCKAAAKSTPTKTSSLEEGLGDSESNNFAHVFSPPCSPTATFLPTGDLFESEM